MHGTATESKFNSTKAFSGSYEKPSSLTVILCILFFLLPLAPSPSSLSQLLLHYIYTKKIQILSSKTWRLKLQLQLRLLFLPGRATPGIPAPRDHDKSTKLLRRWKAVHLSAKCTCEQRWKQLQKRGAPGSCTGTSANGIWPQHYTSQTQLVKSKPCLHRKGVEIPEQQPQKQPGTGRRHLLLCQRSCTPVTAQFGADVAEALPGPSGPVCAQHCVPAELGHPQTLISLKRCCRGSCGYALRWTLQKHHSKRTGANSKSSDVNL